MNIILAGGLGYIGSALIRLLAEDPEVETVWLIDTRFFPHLLADLPDNFHFIHEDIANVDRLAPILAAADVVHVLAGMVEAEKSARHEELVWEINYEKCRKLIEACPDSCRVVFASSGNVFGGVSPDEKWRDLDENDDPRPELPYASSKVAVEKFLTSHRDNHTICRFGTNFGYAPGIRFNLVTNIFVRRMLEGQDLILHGRGENYRPNVHVEDAARGMHFLSKHPEARSGIFHIVRHNMRIRELAEEVVRFSESANLVLDDRPVPFNSYHLSNDKILGLGFEFKWDLRSGVADMVERFKSMRSQT